MALFESIADRRIREARSTGFFDNLPGAGKPIPDLGTERPAGWWGARAVRLERDKIKREDLKIAIDKAKPPILRLTSEAAVVAGLAELNQRITEHNARTTYLPLPLIDVDVIIAQWRSITWTGG